eukprot:COSAG02_NODE_16262_length_1098_cov_1.466466_1_plen_96_part_01
MHGAARACAARAVRGIRCSEFGRCVGRCGSECMPPVPTVTKGRRPSALCQGGYSVVTLGSGYPDPRTFLGMVWMRNGRRYGRKNFTIPTSGPMAQS